MIRSLKRLYGEVTGFKSACLAVLYTTFIVVVMTCILCFFGMLIIGGFNKDFIVSGDLVRDFSVAVITAVSTFVVTCSGAILGAQYIDSKSKEEPKEEQA